MKNQNRTTMGALEYSIATLKEMRRVLLDISDKNAELNWAVGKIITALVSTLLRICHKTFLNPDVIGNPDITRDLKQIQAEFNQFMDRMTGNE